MSLSPATLDRLRDIVGAEHVRVAPGELAAFAREEGSVYNRRPGTRRRPR